MTVNAVSSTHSLSVLLSALERSCTTRTALAPSPLTIVLSYLHMYVCAVRLLFNPPSSFPLLSLSSPSPPLLLFSSLLSLPHPHKGVPAMPFLSAVMPILWPKYVMTSSMNLRCRNNLQLRIPSGWSNSTTRGSSAGELRASGGLSGDHEGTARPDQGRDRPRRSYRVSVILFWSLVSCKAFLKRILTRGHHGVMVPKQVESTTFGG